MKSGSVVNSPALIELLFHYHCRPPDVKPHESPVNADGTIMLVDYGLVVQNEDSYTTTARGKAHIEALCSLPIPEIKWVTPNDIFC